MDDAIAELLGLLRSIQHDVNAQSQKVVAIESKLNLLLLAFPVDGIDSHRSYHENQIILAKERREFKASIQRGIALWGLVAVIPLILFAVWEYIKIKAGK